MKTLEIVPSAAALIQSLRGFGYSPETALADLVDNSISAGADQIDIAIDWNDGVPRVSLLDDGHGMTAAELTAAMCFGGKGANVERGAGDLGRFGLGLKTASLSQCRCMMVVTRCNGETASLSWDLDDVQRSDRWQATIPDPIPRLPLVQKLLKAEHGTTVVWERMDALAGLSGLDRENFFLRIRDIGAYLAMIFHRFLSDDARRISIKVNDRAIESWDPFERMHPATITMQSEPIRFQGSTVRVTPYVLPHRDRYKNDREFERAGGVRGWNERQGFYVYRQKRLLVPGGWLGLGGTRAWTRDESSRLARIAVDLDTSLDGAWRIDVRKSQARPPGPLRARIMMIAASCRDKAREVFVWRGHRISSGRSPRPDDQPIWCPSASGKKTIYRLNREHPAVIAALRSDQANSALLTGLLSLIERSVPVERIWLDVSEAEGIAAPELDPQELLVLAEQLASVVTSMSPDISIAERVDQLVRHLPGDTDRLKVAVFRLLEEAT
jgi:Histidine kinase-, DNA gyrase B-, and HSP90-like ATPase